jgi:hypothetical protein
MSDINVISRMQKVIVDAASSSVSVINIGPQGPPGLNGVPASVSSYTVSGGTTGTQPTFTGNPMFNGTYVLLGQLVYFQVTVEFDNITSFGTGQYYVSLPTTSLFKFSTRNGQLTDTSSGNRYGIVGSVLADSDQLLLRYTGSNGHDEIFDYNSPIVLQTVDDFQISGWYITAAQNNNN